MRRLSAVLALTLALCSIAVGEELTFRGFPFSATPDEVIAQEGQPDFDFTSEEGDLVGAYVIQYDKVLVAGYEAALEIEFGYSGVLGGQRQPPTAGILVGSYTFEFEQPQTLGGVRDPTRYVNAYVDLASKLEGIYGEPDSPPAIEPIEGQISSLLADRYASREPYVVNWSVGDAAIGLQMTYSGRWALTLWYSSPTLTGLLDERQRQMQESTEGL